MLATRVRSSRRQALHRSHQFPETEPLRSKAQETAPARRRRVDVLSARAGRLRVAFFGTPEIARPTLDALLASRHEVVCVVSQPDRPRGRGRKTSPSPISARALEANLPLLRPERVGDPDCVDALRKTSPDAGVVIAFGQFIPRPVRELPSCGYLINAHASLLPRHRGAAPIAQAILDGDEETGISVMRVDKAMDAGPVAVVTRTAIHDQENTLELGERLAQLAGPAILEALDQIADDSITWSPQDPSLATVAPKITRADGWIDWSRGAGELVRQIHALAPRPGAVAHLVGEGGEIEVLRILRARVIEGDESQDLPAQAGPGVVAKSPADRKSPLRVRTGQGWLGLCDVQRAGGRAMSSDAFLRGFELPADAHFSLSPPMPALAEDGA